ncbi:phenolic glucoside malonyltransferase 1-like [Pyrus ussuriensis x Pyrus communis]|uniref:Phenolic glucoside malonyltransferase 1-like n=1 Tax=Pyrus ussuriensis x Pyrus communis TaxID=2448454 RepID=A0A5N5GA63_9ROSA|nr:phenolic glucoside malonyltransferase 1-like [Pyrus ussuriensis x Pyrus communis]
MAEPASVKVVEVCSIALNTKLPGLRHLEDLSLPLTFFDIYWLRPLLSYVTSNAISLIITEFDADFHHLTSSNNFDIKAKKHHPFIPQLAVSYKKAAVLPLQITVFPNSYGLSAFSFFNLWGYLCKHRGREGERSPPSPSYDRKVIKDPAGLQAIYLNEWLRLGGPNHRSLMHLEVKGSRDSIHGTFEFTGVKIQMLRRSVMAVMMVEEKKKQADHDSKLLHLSTFSLTCAYTWACFVRQRMLEFLCLCPTLARRLENKQFI